MTEEEKNEFYETIPAAAKQVKFDLRVQTTATKCYALDMGFYVAEVYMQHYPQVHWMLWKGKDMAFNKPVLAGFKLPLVPSDFVGGCAGKKLKGNDDSDVLLKLYRVWEKDLS